MRLDRLTIAELGDRLRAVTAALQYAGEAARRHAEQPDTHDLWAGVWWACRCERRRITRHVARRTARAEA